MATCCPGLEDVLAQEIAERLGARASAERGRALFDADASASLALRCADNLYGFVGQVRTGLHRADLPDLARSLARLPLKETISQLSPLDVSPALVHLSASRSGKHSYSRFEAAEAVLPALCRAAGGMQGDAERHTCALRLEIEGDRARLFVKYTSAEFRFRGARTFSAAATRPTIAHALVRLTLPDAADRFIDPFCGSGTILSERACYPAHSILGGDIDPAAVMAAKENAKGCQVQVWNALALPLDDASTDAIATNPPWGKQIAVKDDAALYRGAMVEIVRILTPGARAVLLTDREGALLAACKHLGTEAEKLATLSLHGTLAGIWRIAL